ncbi:MAG: type II toxin-antitoxin system HicA family toxin [Armatimonadetes bacterium]|nr:type II toxin-antitoxin system HicA family toxin [Armatimonadota bacterium]PIU64161.1 MAG: hypothetical protein COS85_13585 [Armatimonadetes bacterium CG07_land_8_20_14_0_80_59_28]PIX41146.1 MAG: hypothetical protein COZ56_12830 [Armatimonadetes bacterium CG_4_8_14_3_um_filter_58_9]PIY38532.1 MAG: hypothetical protein COZ05_20670 [Armatimonadetes bacterium CG_4_10_14_3_um_filter_59_10]
MDGFVKVSQRGSHQKWRNDDSNRQVIVPMYRGKVLPRGTLVSIVDGSGLGTEPFCV